MANFSTLFPNLQTDLDFGAGAAQVATWAEGDDTTRIPLSKLPDITIGHTYVFSSNADTEALSLAAYITAFAAGAGTEAAGTRTGDVIDAGDLLILTSDADGTPAVNHLLYTGAQGTAGTTTLVAGDFTSITAGSALTDGVNTTANGSAVDLNASLTGMTGIAQTTATTLAIGINDDVNGSNVEIRGSKLTLESSRALQSLDIVSAAAINIDAVNSTTVDVSSGGFGVTTAGVQAYNATAGVSAIDIVLDANGAAKDAGVAGIRIDAGVNPIGVFGENITAPSSGSSLLGVDSNGFLTTVASGVGAYAFNTHTDSAASSTAGEDIPLNTVTLIADQSGARTLLLPTGTVAGQWVKIINLSTTSTITLSSSQGFPGTADTTLVLNDASANFELIYTGITGDGWAIIAQ